MSCYSHTEKHERFQGTTRASQTPAEQPVGPAVPLPHCPTVVVVARAYAAASPSPTCPATHNPSAPLGCCLTHKSWKQAGQPTLLHPPPAAGHFLPNFSSEDGAAASLASEPATILPKTAREPGALPHTSTFEGCSPPCSPPCPVPTALPQGPPLWRRPGVWRGCLPLTGTRSNSPCCQHLVSLTRQENKDRA